MKTSESFQFGVWVDMGEKETVKVDVGIRDRGDPAEYHGGRWWAIAGHGMGGFWFEPTLRSSRVMEISVYLCVLLINSAQ